jgi:hypothetical protein
VLTAEVRDRLGHPALLARERAVAFLRERLGQPVRQIVARGEPTRVSVRVVGRDEGGTAMNPRGHTRISTLLVFTLDSRHARVEADLRYDTTDPYAVAALFQPAGSDELRWTFARDLLEEGLVSWAGVGDVRIGPDQDDPLATCLELITPGSRALLRVSTEEITTFLHETYRAVPPGKEGDWLDLDSQIERFQALSARDPQSRG